MKDLLSCLCHEASEVTRMEAYVRRDGERHSKHEPDSREGHETCVTPETQEHTFCTNTHPSVAYTREPTLILRATCLQKEETQTPHRHHGAGDHDVCPQKAGSRVASFIFFS